MQEYLHIKDKDIPVVIRNYKNAKYIMAAGIPIVAAICKYSLCALST